MSDTAVDPAIESAVAGYFARFGRPSATGTEVIDDGGAVCVEAAAVFDVVVVVIEGRVVESQLEVRKVSTVRLASIDSVTIAPDRWAAAFVAGERISVPESVAEKLSSLLVDDRP